MTDEQVHSEADSEGPSWRPLNAAQRRVAGVLVEKAKTVPESYPLTLNSLTTGCNQKSNRHPLMSLNSDDVLDVIEELRILGAVTEVHDSGRALKYRHRMYEWLDVDKYEMAVMTELLLRGEQTVGELRSRAARMEPIADLAALRPILQSLTEKKLVVALTPEGRGQIVTHALYSEKEMEALKARTVADPGTGETPTPAPRPAPPAPDVVAELRAEITALREEVAQLRAEVRELKEKPQG